MPSRIRAALRRLRQARVAEAESTIVGPVYVPVPGGVMGCQFCATLRELFSFVGITDMPRYSRLFREGNCAITMPPVRFIKIEGGEDYSLFKLINPVSNPGPDGILPLWFRNEDMVIEGGNAQSDADAHE